MNTKKVLTIILTSAVVSVGAATAEAASITCTGWGGSQTMSGAAYVVATANLYRTTASGSTLVETSVAEAVWRVAGTQFIGGSWVNVPLDGSYFAIVQATFYMGLDHYPTATELSAWPSTRTYHGTSSPEYATCVAPPRCGDGRVNQASEQCDDGNTVGGDGCSASCQIEPPPPPPPPAYCGDGLVNQGFEECDDGNTLDGDGCSSGCWIEPPPPRCGDGLVNLEAEQCDDGNTLDGDGCSATCTLEVWCGDGQVNQPTEQCDDGNTTNGDGCSSTCAVEPLSGCTYTIGYWGTHYATARNTSQRRGWPIAEGTAFCGSTWLTTINATPRGGDALLILARQWIGARLNVAAHAGTTTSQAAAIARAAQLLADCTITAAERAEATDLASLLDSYNNGLIGPGHCP